MIDDGDDDLKAITLVSFLQLVLGQGALHVSYFHFFPKIFYRGDYCGDLRIGLIFFKHSLMTTTMMMMMMM